MREEFLRAARQNPKSPIADAVRGIERTQFEGRRAERRAKELEKLGGRFEYIGNNWLNQIMGNPITISIRDLRKEWGEELLPQLSNSEVSERPQIISRLAKGLMLSENLNSSYRVTVASVILNNPLGELSQMFITKKISPASKVFLQAISDISGYSRKQKALFGNFMNGRKDLQGSVTLPQTFPAVAEWLVQQNNTAKT